MMKLLLATALTGLVLAANAHAGEAKSPTTTHTQQASLTKVFSAPRVKSHLRAGAKIGIARIDKGRLIFAPNVELRDWAFLDRRSPFEFAPVSPAAHIKTLPEIPMDGRDSYYQLDEIRMTASTLGMDYVLFYAKGKDARAGGFGGKSMYETGLAVKDGTPAPGGDAKAILVNTFSGEILGTVVSDDVEFTVGDLTDKVESLLKSLSQNTSAKA